jgi:hypothetical protein
MPEISRFNGIIVRMFWETGGQDHAPHLHASYQGQVASYDLDTAELLAGSLPRRQHRLIVAWIERNREELMENWRRALNHEPIDKIPPLR